MLIALVHVMAIPTPADLITNSNNLYQAQPADQVVSEATGELVPELIQSTATKWKNFAVAMNRATSADEMNDAHATIFADHLVPEATGELDPELIQSTTQSNPPQGNGRGNGALPLPLPPLPWPLPPFQD